MKRLLAISAVLIPIYLFAQGFGSFSHDQPYFAADAGTACPFILDDMETYSDFVLVDGLNGGCLWNGAYVTWGNTINHFDDMESYVNGDMIDNEQSGINWFSYYASHSFYYGLSFRYLDTMQTYTNTATVNGLDGGTNYVTVSGQQVATNWPDLYNAKGY